MMPDPSTQEDLQTIWEIVELVRPYLPELALNLEAIHARTSMKMQAIAALETWLVSEYQTGVETNREETIIRRSLWMIRGSNEEPPHPDRREL